MSKKRSKDFALLIFLLLFYQIKSFGNSGVTLNFDEDLHISPGWLVFQDGIHGKIVDEDGNPIIGASVNIASSNKGAISDNDGNFSLENVPMGTVLTISSVGFEIQTVVVKDSKPLRITLSKDIAQLESVIVTGYGTQKKKDIIGSISVVDTKELKSVPTGSAAQALQGQAAGVDIIKSGQSGAASTIHIRGIGSFGDNNPLVLVDGVESSLENVNPQDIASMQILKDAGAAAIYGVRGSNGVVLITTKKGRGSKPTVNYNGYVGTTLPLKKNAFDLANTDEYAKIFSTAIPNSVLFSNGIPDYLYGSPSGHGVAMEGNPVVDPSNYHLDLKNPTSNYLISKVDKKGVDWYREVFKPALQHQHDINVSGQTDNAGYFFGLNYLDEQNTLIRTYLKRISFRVNTDFKIGKNVTVGENMMLFTAQNPQISNVAEGNPITNIFKSVPFTPVYDIMGNFSGQFEGPTSEMGNGENPVAQMERTKNDIHRQWRAIGNAYMDIDFAKNFKFHTSYGINVLNQYDRSFTFNNYDEKEGFANPNALSESRGNSFYWIWTNTLNYNKDFGENSLNILIGSEAIETTNQSLSGSRQNFFTDAEDFLILDNGTQNITNSSSISSQSLFSLFGKIDYSFSDKYLLGVTLRRDGSSRFGIADKYGVFPSFSVGWRLSRERFLSNLEWLTNLLVRGSYGILGSQNNVNSTNAFTTFSSNVNNSYYDISGTNTSSAPGIYQSHIGNEKTSWEKDKVLNVGIDGVFFNGKLSFTGEYYDKRINGLLFSQPLPATAGGAGSPVINIGNIRNKGFDFSVGYQDNILKDFGYRAALNLTSYKNDVVSVPDPGYFDTYNSRFGTLIRNQEGSAVSSFFGYKVIGLFQSQDDVDHSPTQSGAAPGRFKYEDVNGDGSITPDDRVVLGSPNPDFSYGLNVGVNFRNFDLSAIFYGVQGSDIFRYTKWFTYFMSSYRDGKSKEMLNAWTPDNTNTDIPINETTSNFSTSSVANSFYVENGSFLKLRSLSVGYNFTKEILNKSKIKSLRVYLQGTNLFTATKYKGLDPEILSSGSNASFGVDLGTYPTNERSFVFGINLSF